ncbi:helix-turn-helix transcriptional regulator [Streptomyces sp. NPDC052069]|uniref:helix-turn-helix domain-containing protein n=1 Tax=Streptomyces sp. NPDC052069 TaxID=3154650 RepID=UPI0034430A93
MSAKPLEIGAAGVHAGQAVARLREARGWDQQELIARLSEAGRSMSQPIVSRIEAGARRVDVDDLVALAAVFDVSVAALFPDDGRRAPAAVPAALAAARSDAGPVESALTEDIEALGDLLGMEPTLAEVAYRLARQMDGQRPASCDECGCAVDVPSDPRLLPQLAKELRATVAALVEGRAMDDDDDDDLGDLGTV